MSRQVVVEIVGDPSKYTKAMSAAESGSKKFAAVTGAVTGVVAGFTMKAIDFVMEVGSEIINLGPKMEAMDAKAKTVFGGSLGAVQKWADANAQAMGLTSREAVGLATNMGDLLIPMGMTRDQAASMSTDIVGLSGALSEWSGGTRTAAEVSEILQKGLLGERDGLKELGISISEADVQQQLLADGTSKLTGAELQQAKANATLTLYMGKTKDAQKAYTDGTAVGIREQHKMEAQLNTVKETIAAGLQPVLRAVTGWIAENLPKAIRFLGEVWKEIGPPIGNIIKLLMEVGKVVLPVLGTAIGIIVSAFKSAWTIISGIAGKISSVFTGIVNGIKGAINTLIRGWNSLHFTLPRVDLPWGGSIGGFDIGTPNLPYLHAGGIVPGAPGSDQLAILQAGERVIPRKDAGGSGGITIIVQGSVYGDLDKFAKDLAFRLRTTG